MPDGEGRRAESQATPRSGWRGAEGYFSRTTGTAEARRVTRRAQKAPVEPPTVSPSSVAKASDRRESHFHATIRTIRQVRRRWRRRTQRRRLPRQKVWSLRRKPMHPRRREPQLRRDKPNTTAWNRIKRVVASLTTDGEITMFVAQPQLWPFVSRLPGGVVPRGNWRHAEPLSCAGPSTGRDARRVRSAYRLRARDTHADHGGDPDDSPPKCQRLTTRCVIPSDARRGGNKLRDRAKRCNAAICERCFSAQHQGAKDC